MTDPAFIIEVTHQDEDRWRATLGQADMNDWCHAHGWRADRIKSGTVRVARWPDGYQAVSAYEYIHGPDGKILANPDGTARVRMHANKPLRRSLPEGIGHVSPAPGLD